MSSASFQTLIDVITAQEEGWDTALDAAWWCLTEPQKLYLSLIF